MGIKIGNLDLSNIYVGNSQVSKVYVGNVLKWSSGPTIKAGDYALPANNIAYILTNSDSFTTTINMRFTSNSETFSSITFIYNKTTTSGETNWTMKYDDTVVATATYNTSAIAYTENAYRIINVPSNVSISEETLELFNTVARERVHFFYEGKINNEGSYTIYYYAAKTQFVCFSKSVAKINNSIYFLDNDNLASDENRLNGNIKLYVSYDGGLNKTLISDSSESNAISSSPTTGGCLPIDISLIDMNQQNITFVLEAITNELYDVVYPGTNTINIECAGILTENDLDLEIVDGVFYNSYGLTQIGIRDRDRTIKNDLLTVTPLTLQNNSLNINSMDTTPYVSYFLPVQRTYNLECSFYANNKNNYLLNTNSLPIYKNKTIVQTTEQSKLIVYLQGAFSTDPTFSFKAETGQSGTITCDGISYNIDDTNSTSFTVGHGLHEIDCSCEFYGYLSNINNSTTNISIMSLGSKFTGGDVYYTGARMVMPTANNLSRYGNGIIGDFSPRIYGYLGIYNNKFTYTIAAGSCHFCNDGATYGTLESGKYFLNENSSNENPNIPNIVTGSSKNTKSFTFYTDNSVLRTGLLAKADSYTTVTVKHLDGTDWS